MGHLARHLRAARSGVAALPHPLTCNTMERRTLCGQKAIVAATWAPPRASLAWTRVHKDNVKSAKCC